MRLIKIKPASASGDQYYYYYEILDRSQENMKIRRICNSDFEIDDFCHYKRVKDDITKYEFGYTIYYFEFLKEAELTPNETHRVKLLLAGNELCG